MNLTGEHYCVKCLRAIDWSTMNEYDGVHPECFYDGYPLQTTIHETDTDHEWKATE